MSQIFEMRALLVWAVEFVERETQIIEASFRDPVTGDMDDDDVGVHVREAREWLENAKFVLAST